MSASASTADLVPAGHASNLGCKQMTGRRPIMTKGDAFVKLGFVGLGAMGQLIVPRLMSAGHEVTGWNRSRDKAEASAFRDYAALRSTDELDFADGAARATSATFCDTDPSA